MGAFQQLAIAKLISFTPNTYTSYVVGSALPPVKLNSTKSFFFGANYNFRTFGGNPNTTNYAKGNNAMFFAFCNVTNGTTLNTWNDNCDIFSAVDLRAIDIKIDDGKPLSGRLIGYGGQSASSGDCLINPGDSNTDYMFSSKILWHMLY